MKLAYGQRLLAARKNKKLSQEKLAEISGVGQGTISKIERGDQDSSAYDSILAHHLDINAMWLTTGDDEFKPTWLGGPHVETRERVTDKDFSNVYEINRKLGKVPLISFVRAGDWCEAINNYAPGDAEEWLECPRNHGQYTYALRVVGDSMTCPYPGKPSYPEGVIIYVDPERPITNGCRIVAKLPNSNDVTFKEYREENGKRYLKPLNPQYPMMEISDEHKICGVVIGQFLPE